MKESAYIPEEHFDDALMAAAQSAVGAIYYETELSRIQDKDGLWQIRIVVREKYRRPNRKAAALLKKYGIKATLRPYKGK